MTTTKTTTRWQHGSSTRATTNYPAEKATMLKEGLLALVLRASRGVEVGSDALLSQRFGVLCSKAVEASGSRVMPASSRGSARKQCVRRKDRESSQFSNNMEPAPPFGPRALAAPTPSVRAVPKKRRSGRRRRPARRFLSAVVGLHSKRTKSVTMPLVTHVAD